MNKGRRLYNDSIAQILDEYRKTERRGEKPTIEEYVKKYPQHEQELREELEDYEWAKQFFSGVSLTEDLSDIDTDAIWENFYRRIEREELAWAAADKSEIDDIRDRIGTEFERVNPVNLKFYTGYLYFRDENSVLFRFRKGGKPTSDLDGKSIEFYVAEEQKPFSQTIQKGAVVINFSELGISLEDYAKVRYRLFINDSTIIEGALKNE